MSGGIGGGFDAVELLRALVRIPSVNPHGDPGTTDAAHVGERACAAWVADRLEALGAAVELREVLPGRPNVLARFPADRPGKGAVLFAPHTDTVSVAGMTVAPFDGEIRDDGRRLFGRGATDTKGTLAAVLAAFAALRDDLPRLGKEIWFAGLMDEEAGNLGARALAADEAWRQAEFAVVGEPTGCDIVRAHKGALWLRLRTRGRAVHGAQPERGENAVHKMADVLRAVRDELMPRFFAAEPDPLLGPATANVGTIRGGSKINIVPDRCEAELDVRTVPAQGRAGFVEEVVAFLRTTAACPDLEADLIRRHAPLDTAADHWGVRALEAAGGRCVGAPWFCDGSILASEGGTPSVAAGPGFIAQAHTADEFLDLDELRRGVEFYRRFLLSL